MLEDTVEKLEQERAAAMSQAVDEEQQHKVQEALDWFAAKMSVFSKEEQEAINACAIAFAERDQIVIPKVSIAVNAKCSQADLMAYASFAFFKIGKKRKDAARFLSIVFEACFPGGEGFVYKCIRRCQGRKDSFKYGKTFQISFFRRYNSARIGKPRSVHERFSCPRRFCRTAIFVCSKIAISDI